MNVLWILFLISIPVVWAVAAIIVHERKRRAYIKHETEYPWDTLVEIVGSRKGYTVTFKDYVSVAEQSLLDQGYITMASASKRLNHTYPMQVVLEPTDSGYVKGIEYIMRKMLDNKNDHDMVYL